MSNIFFPFLYIANGTVLTSRQFPFNKYSRLLEGYCCINCITPTRKLVAKNESACCHFFPKLNVNWVPSPTTLTMSIVPPKDSICDLTKNKPNPFPSVLS